MFIKVLLVILFFMLFASCSVDSGSDNTGDRNSFYHVDQIEARLSEIVESYRSVAKLETIGFSVSSRKITAVKISDNVNTDESEPAVRLIGNIHGNEKMSAELLLKLAEYLTTNYSKDDQIRELVDNLEIWIIPVLNPDGMENRNPSGEFESIRYNSNGVDLNRNFSFSWSSNEVHGSAPFSEKESIALRGFSIRENFTSGISFHTGALCISYLTDYISESSEVQIMGLNNYKERILPDYDIVEELADMYFKNHKNESFYKTNGGDWYPIDGSIGDWSYFNRGVLDFTVELSNDKYPYFTYDNLSSRIDGIWLDNRDAVLDFLSTNVYSLQGVVLDKDSGEPLSAIVTVLGNKVLSYTSEINGSFGRLLGTGTYNLTISAQGYSPIEINDVSVGNNLNDLGKIYLEKSTSQDRNNFKHSVIQPQFTDRVRKSEYYNREE